ncbi:MAG: response regulator transcription factor [Bacteroidetes bacterium]|nr:response regulator transcription factor [Bacteroidota bacterium]
MNIVKKKIVIVEDQSDLRESYNLIINGTNLYEVIGLYSTAEEAITKIQKRTPDIILMDIQLPGMSGVEATRIIKERNHLVEIVMLTVHDDDEFVFDSLKAGASGYIIKGTSYVEMIEALDEIVSGGAPMSNRIARMVINNFHANLNSPLTKRERQILQLMSKGWTYSQIAEELAISKETSKTHIRNIYVKLEVNSKSEAIAKATKERILV